jgi:hypothetical protein
MGQTPATITLTGPQDDLQMIVKWLTEQARRKHRRGYPNVCWDMESVQPPAPQYITRDTYLALNVYSCSGNAPVLNVSAKIMLPDGRITVQTWSTGAITGGAKAAYTYALDEGFLLSAAVSLTFGSTIERGEVFVQVQLQNNTATGAAIFRMLVSEYVTTTASIGWPEWPLNSNLTGPGYLRVITVGNPGVGADWTTTLPTNSRYWVHAIHATLTTGVDVANRTPVFQLEFPGGQVIWNVGASALIAASAAATYNLGEGLALGVDASSNYTVPLPTEAYLEGGSIIHSVTGNLQADDQWSAIYITLEQWPEF